MKMKEFNNANITNITNITSFKLKSTDCQNYPKGDTAASGGKRCSMQIIQGKYRL